MRITTITVELGRTESLGNYSNVRPSVSLTAELEPGEDEIGVVTLLQAHCRFLVEAEIDDALEADDQPAKYSAEPRYQVVYSVELHGGYNRPRRTPSAWVLAILPQTTVLPGSLWAHVYTGRKVRLAHAQRIAAAWFVDRVEQDERAFTLIDASSGDLSALPPEWFVAPVKEAEPPVIVDADEPPEPTA